MKRRIVPTVLVAGVALGLASFALAQDAPEAPASDAPLEVTEILMGTELERGVPTSPATSFSRTTPSIYCMVRFRNRTGEEGSIRIAFERAGEEAPAARATGQRLHYPARGRYRTVARGTPNRAPGAYRCVVRTDEGAVLSHHDFRITD